MSHEHACKVSAQSDHKRLSIGAVDQDWTVFPECDFLPLQAMSGHPINMSGHPVPVTVLNDFKLCPRSRDCEAIINTSL
jgi:hypothetical protein